MSCTELPPVLRALVDSRCAWLTEPEIAYALNWRRKETRKEVNRLLGCGYADLHTLADGSTVVTFSPLGAAAFEYELTDDDDVSTQATRWVSRRSRRRPAPEPEEEGDRIERVPDRRPGPVDQLILQEEDVGRPIVILMGHAGWGWAETLAKGETRPSTECRECSSVRKKRKVLKAKCECGRGLRRRPRLEVCPACKGRPLSRWTYCLRCSRWGWDEFFHPKRTAQRA